VAPTPGRAERHRRRSACKSQYAPTRRIAGTVIGLAAVAGGLIGARVELQVLEQVLGSAAGAVDIVVERLARSLKTGGDEPGIRSEARRLAPREHAAFKADGAARHDNANFGQVSAHRIDAGGPLAEQQLVQYRTGIRCRDRALSTSSSRLTELSSSRPSGQGSEGKRGSDRLVKDTKKQYTEPS
jgi:hypothetical protein